MTTTTQRNHRSASNGPLETVQLDADPEGTKLLEWLAVVLRTGGPESRRLRTIISTLVYSDATDLDGDPSSSASPSMQQCPKH